MIYKINIYFKFENDKVLEKYILWFAQEHVDFRVAEFESIVKLFGLDFRHLNENLLVNRKTIKKCK